MHNFRGEVNGVFSAPDRFCRETAHEMNEAPPNLGLHEAPAPRLSYRLTDDWMVQGPTNKENHESDNFNSRDKPSACRAACLERRARRDCTYYLRQRRHPSAQSVLCGQNVLDVDGVLEIVCGSSAPSNGYKGLY